MCAVYLHRDRLADKKLEMLNFIIHDLRMLMMSKYFAIQFFC